MMHSLVIARDELVARLAVYPQAEEPRADTNTKAEGILVVPNVQPTNPICLGASWPFPSLRALVGF